MKATIIGSFHFFDLLTNIISKTSIHRGFVKPIAKRFSHSHRPPQSNSRYYMSRIFAFWSFIINSSHVATDPTSFPSFGHLTLYRHYRRRNPQRIETF